jgi:hypothetical protein
MTEIQHLAKLAYQNGDKALQRGWWDYVKARANELGIEIAEVLGEIERLKSSEELPMNGA